MQEFATICKTTPHKQDRTHTHWRRVSVLHLFMSLINTRIHQAFPYDPLSLPLIQWKNNHKTCQTKWDTHTCTHTHTHTHTLTVSYVSIRCTWKPLAARLSCRSVLALHEAGYSTRSVPPANKGHSFWLKHMQASACFAWSRVQHVICASCKKKAFFSTQTHAGQCLLCRKQGTARNPSLLQKKDIFLDSNTCRAVLALQEAGYSTPSVPPAKHVEGIGCWFTHIYTTHIYTVAIKRTWSEKWQLHCKNPNTAHSPCHLLTEGILRSRIRLTPLETALREKALYTSWHGSSKAGHAVYIRCVHPTNE